MRLFVLIGVLAAVLVTHTYAQEEIIALNSLELGEHQRPIVRFAHEKHAEQIGCNACHHDYDEYGVNTNEDEGQRCAECHSLTAGTNPIPLKRAYHLQCKGCHQKQVKNNESTGPMMCGQCHTKKQSAPE